MTSRHAALCGTDLHVTLARLPDQMDARQPLDVQARVHAEKDTHTRVRARVGKGYDAV